MFSLLSISFYICLGSWIGELKKFCFNLNLGSLCFFTVNWIPFPVHCSSSLFFAIYNFLAIVLVGSRKALRSRLGFLVSGSWDLNFSFQFPVYCFFCSFTLLLQDPIQPKPSFTLLFDASYFSLFNFCKSKSQSPLQFKSFTFLAL